MQLRITVLPPSGRINNNTSRLQPPTFDYVPLSVTSGALHERNQGRTREETDQLIQDLATTFNLDIPLVRDVLEGEGGDESRCLHKLHMLAAEDQS